MTVLFPDIEKLLVAYLSDTLASLEHEAAQDVRVATKKAPADLVTQPTKEVVVTASFGQTLDFVRRSATATLEVYADDYETASTLALLVGAVVVNIPGEHIKRAVVSLGPVRTTEDGQQEKRSMSVDLTVKGADI